MFPARRAVDVIEFFSRAVVDGPFVFVSATCFRGARPTISGARALR